MPMTLAGTLVKNLQGALASVKRLRSEPVYTETIEYWTALVRHARERLVAGDPPDRAAVHSLCERLAAEIEVRRTKRLPDERTDGLAVREP